MVKKAIDAQRARAAARTARDTIRRKSSLEGAGMPDKLKDCSSRNRKECELFIVEGDSAGGSAIKGRDPRTQAILPIRGKILNVERARIDRMLKNNEIQSLISAIGAGFGDEDFDVAKIRYDKVILLCRRRRRRQPHPPTLLPAHVLLPGQMKPMVRGRVRLTSAQPPLYSTVVGKEKVYLKDDAARTIWQAEHPNHKKEFQRLKGLGEMDWDELKETTMEAGRRTLLQVTVEQAASADSAVSRLMGDDVDARKTFIQQNAKDVRFLDI